MSFNEKQRPSPITPRRRRNSIGTPEDMEDRENNPFLQIPNKSPRQLKRSNSFNRPKTSAGIDMDDVYGQLGAMMSPKKPFKGKAVKRGVRVFIRIRPSLKYEIKKGGKPCVRAHDDLRSISVDTPEKELIYRFDRVFDQTTDQDMIYDEAVSPVVSDVLDGFNASVVAYGQTSSGKTYTMLGPGFEYKKDNAQQRRRFYNNEREWGIIPRLIKNIFGRIEKEDTSKEFVVVSSFVEIYQERIQDLLNPRKNNLRVLEDRKSGLYITKATEIPVTCLEGVLEVLKTGLKNRFVAETKCNTESSRSHAIFILTIYTHDIVEKITKCSQLYLVDLAGSEKVCKTQATGVRLDEAKKINVSLLALRKVIFALTAPKLKNRKKKTYVPYRDSKLTRILQNSFGGNAISVLIMNVSPSTYNLTETVSTLRFGERSLRIKNKPKANKRRTVEELEGLLKKREARIQHQSMLIKSLQSEIKQVRAMGRTMSASGSGGGESSSPFGGALDLTSFHSYFLCPISRRVMVDPVIALDGITYERDAIMRYLKDRKHKMISPVTNKRMLSKLCISNITVKTQIEHFGDMYEGIFDNIDYSAFEDDGYIPDDCLFMIFRYLSAIDIVRCGRTCLQWYQVTKSDLLWKPLFIEKFGKIKGFPTDVQDWKEMFWKQFKGTYKRAPWNTKVKKIKDSLYLFKRK